MMTRWYKPHIRYSGNRWWCETIRCGGFGSTPRLAYEAWKRQANRVSP